MKRHPFDPWSFVFGSMFLIAGWAFLSESVDVLDMNFGLIWPVPFLAVGLLVLLTSIRRVRQHGPVGVQEDPEPPPAPPLDGSSSPPPGP
jgi:hypothetical protein